MASTPSAVRQLYRTANTLKKSTFGICPGYLQTNMAMLPSSVAKDFQEFCNKNWSACPVIYASDVGGVSADVLAEDSNIRTDLASYNVYGDGKLTKTVDNLLEYDWNNMVSFYLGCSFSFDDQLINNGIKLRTDTNVSMYLTNIACHPVGPFKTNMVVSMRPILKSKLDTVVQCTADLNFAHGAPIHIGDHEDIGISDVMNVDFGQPSQFLDDEVPVFWACGVTSSCAIRSASLPLSFSHTPGSMLVCDIKSVDAPKLVNNKTYPKPVVVEMNAEKQKYSIISEKALQSLNTIETVAFEDLGHRGIEELLVSGDFAKSVLTLSKDAFHVGIIFGFPCFIEGTPLDENDGIAGAIYIARALRHLGKKVTFIVDSGSSELIALLNDSLSPYLSNVDVKSIGKNFKEEDTSFLFDKETSKPIFSHLLAIERPSPSDNGTYNTMKARNITNNCDPTHILFKQALSSGKITTIGIGDGGNELGMGKVQQQVVKTVPFGEAIASSISCDYLMTCGVSNWGGFSIASGLHVLSRCPVFQRFKYHGIDGGDAISLDDFLLSKRQDEELNKLIGEKGFRDGTNGNCDMTIDGLDYYDVHVPQFEKMRKIATSFSEDMKQFE